MNLTSHVIEGMKEQARQTALFDCFKSWDGDTDLEVILQGLHDRFKAIGKEVKELSVKRSSLSKVHLYADDVEICTILGFNDGKVPKTFWLIDKPVSYAEDNHMATWLSENFYHV